jgi:hypothetical protein
VRHRAHQRRDRPREASPTFREHHPKHNEFVALPEKLDSLPNRPGVYLFKDAGGR